MEKNVGLSFDATIKANDAKTKLHVPMIAKKPNQKDSTIKLDGSQSSLNSLVKVKDLLIDLSYQRLPNEDKVVKIAKSFNPDAIGVLICSIREDGTIAVIDGGHRVAALRMLNLDDYNVDCLVYVGLTLAEEAQIFNLMNDNRTKPKTSDIFKSKVVAGDKDSMIIDRIIKKHNLTIENRPTVNAIRAIGTLTNLYKKNGAENIDKTIGILKEAFGNRSADFADSALIAVSNLIAKFPDILENRLIDALKKQVNVNFWTNSGTNLSKQIGAKDRSVGMMLLVAKDYNKRMKTNRIIETLIW